MEYLGSRKVLNDSGICPFCKNYQHWSQNAKKPIKWGIGSYIFSFFLAVVPSMIMVTVTADILDIQGLILLVPFFAMFGIVYALVVIFGKKRVRKITASVTALENLEKREPYIISWGEANHNSIGLSVR